VASRFFAQGDVRYRHGAAGGTIAEFVDGLSKYTLWGLEDKITCPYFNIGRQGEGQLAVDGQKFYDKLTCPMSLAALARRDDVLRPAWRIGFWPNPAEMTLPMMHSSTLLGSIPARLTASRTTMAPSCGALKSESEP
jgi:hypothetical protein